jgi:hypothetical protein
LPALVAPETAGDPMSEQQWGRRRRRPRRRRVTAAGQPVSHQTVGRRLKDLADALHGNAKKIEARATHPDRDAQFTDIATQRQAFAARGRPIISVATKQTDRIGNFKNAGPAWSREAEAVNVHDFLADGLGRTVPYGSYAVGTNHGTVCVGASGDPPAFAVAAIARWWEDRGTTADPAADQVLILADGGGSNGYRPRAWKQHLQEQVCDRLGLTVTVCHSPTGCSKWNPVEHRLFGPIRLNWAGTPLRTGATLLGAIRGTTTTTGLTVEAIRLAGEDVPGQRVSDAAMAALLLDRHAVCPTWTYTLRPRPPLPPAQHAEPGCREVIP